MSEEREDTKPKINITIKYGGDGEKQITVAVKRTTKFSKVFTAAEKKFEKDPGTLKFVLNGDRLRPEETPGDHDIEDDDIIYAFLEQQGGTRFIVFA
ncbi:ubiquitin-like protein [Armillaria gallica]|uniref:Ubiquitin-like protein n=1 Tax=Armillaria gallica TaxID=47427 RepID=A0A2H3DWZ9_ARMGA|nr:ubiquitin-like protein [Armillaria gallica]